MVSPSPKGFAYAYDLGASAVLPWPSEEEMLSSKKKMKHLPMALVRCLKNLSDQIVALTECVTTTRERISLLNQCVREIGSRSGCQDITLVVLRYVAEYLDRCVVFLVRKSDLLGLGAFGLDGSASTFSRAVAKVELPERQDSILKRVVENGYMYLGEPRDPWLERGVYSKIGKPRNQEILLVPLDHLMNPANHRADYTWNPEHPVHFFNWNDKVIWGLTGNMVHQLLQVAFDFTGDNNG